MELQDRRHNLDPVTNRKKWSEDIEKSQGQALNYLPVGCREPKIAKAYEVLWASEGDSSGGCTAADNAIVRMVFLVGLDKKFKLSLAYLMSTSRNFDKVLWDLNFCHLNANHKIATPINWKQVEDATSCP